MSQSGAELLLLLLLLVVMMMMVVMFQDRISLCGPGWSGTHYVATCGHPPVSASHNYKYNYYHGQKTPLFKLRFLRDHVTLYAWAKIPNIVISPKSLFLHVEAG